MIDEPELKQMVKREELAPQTTPDKLLALAIDKDLDIDKLSRLMELQREHNAEVARQAFEKALGEFQEKCPDIRKTKRVFFETRTGSTEYFYAPLADIDRQIKHLMKECGLTKKWKPFINKDEIKVICIISHVGGHKEETEMSSTADASGSKNPTQAIASTVEYLKRHTLLAALGITTADSDIDGRLPELDIDKLHKNYMELYNEIIQKDKTFISPGDPDNWQADRTPELYVKAIGRARKILFDLTKHTK